MAPTLDPSTLTQAEPNVTLTTPTVRKAGTYFVKVWHVRLATGAQFWRGTVSRQGSAMGFVRITGAHASSAAGVVAELRRNVRTARKCGGLK